MWGRYLGPSLYVLSAVGILFGCGPVPVQKRFREHLNVGVVPPRIHVTSVSRELPQELKVGWVGYIEGKEITIVADNCFTEFAREGGRLDSHAEYQLDRIWGWPIAIKAIFKSNESESQQEAEPEYSLTIPARPGFRRVVQLSVIDERRLLDEEEFLNSANSDPPRCYDRLDDPRHKHTFIVVEVLKGRVKEEYFYKRGRSRDPIELVITREKQLPGTIPAPTTPTTPPFVRPQQFSPAPTSESKEKVSDTEQEVSGVKAEQEDQPPEIRIPAVVPQFPAGSRWQRQGEHNNVLILMNPAGLGFKAKWIKLRKRPRGNKPTDSRGRAIREVRLGNYVAFPWVNVKILGPPVKTP